MFTLCCGLHTQVCRALARKKNITGNEFRKGSFCAGFSYVEVLLSLAIFSIGMLSFAHLQIFNARLAQESLINSKASLLMDSAREQVLAAGELVDKKRWQEKVKSSLPEGKIHLQEEQGMFELDISWLPQFEQQGEGVSNHLTVKLVSKDG